LRVFDQLTAAFSGAADRRLTAFHSLNLTRHADKRFGEIDFLIVGRPGIFVLEVKGGGITCTDGKWESTDRHGRPHRLRESPFRQAQTALHALMEKVGEAVPESTWSRFTMGYGVILPDCDFTVAGSEWDAALVADARSVRNLERWLAGLSAYWRDRDSRRRAEPRDEDLATLKRFLRPGFEAAIALHVQVAEVEQRAVALTDSQMHLVDVVEANPRVLCAGGAGTGKTFLALEIARRWAAKDLQVLVACSSPWLRHWLEARFAVPGVTVALAGSVARAARRLSLERFDALIVDEGQDLLDLGSLDKLDTVLSGGLGEGRWCFFHDINNQAGLLGAAEPEAMALLESYQPVKVPLTANCRNTRQILEEVQSTLGADMGVRGTGDGPKVRKARAASQSDAARLLSEEIEWLVDRGGLDPGSITILSPVAFPESAAGQLPAGLRSKIQVLDEYAMRSFPIERIGFARIGDFKGLENEAVVVIDVPAPGAGADARAQSYVAMSRPRAVLSMIMCE